METLPMMPEKCSLLLSDRQQKQYGLVKKQLFRKDVNQIIIATDAGREGELVARWILEKSECKKPIKRLWISSVTDKAIREGFATCVTAERTTIFTMRQKPGQKRTGWSASTLPER